MNIFLQSIGFLGLFVSLALARPECPNTLAFYNPNDRTTCYNASQSQTNPYISVCLLLMGLSMVYPPSPQSIGPGSCQIPTPQSTLQ